MTLALTSPVRPVAWQLLALNEDLSTAFDLSPYLQSADLQFTDESGVSHQGTFVLANPGALFDQYNTGSAGAGILTDNRLIQYKKGFTDPATGTATLYPAFLGRITSGRPAYARTMGEKITVVGFDLLKLSLRQHFTTGLFSNTQINLVAAALDQTYGDKAGALLGTNLYALNYLVAAFQGTDMALIEMYQDLFDIPLYFFWKNYAGQLASRPRLGSAASGSPGYTGYPDATGPPDSSLVAFTFPDATLIEQIEPEWTDAESMTNQVRVLGYPLTESITLGPSQVLTNLGDPVNFNFQSTGTGEKKRLFFSQQSGNNNNLSAQGVYLKIWDPSFSNDTGGTPYKYLASGPGILNDVGAIIPYPVDEQAFPPNTQNVVSRKSSGVIEGGIALVAVTPNFCDLSVFANTDGGGFEWAVEVHGRPVLTAQATITAIVDYEPQGISETLTDVFGDHQTYQGSKAPWCGGTPIEVSVNASGLPNTTLTAASVAGASMISVASAAGLLPPSLPAITGPNVLAIGSGAAREYAIIQSIAGSVLTLTAPLASAHASGDPVNTLTAVLSQDDVFRSLLVKADWARGRVVFNDLTYRPFVADELFTGGAPSSNTVAFNLQYLTAGAVLAVYQTNRQCAFNTTNGIQYALPGLVPGQGYTVRLHFADPTSTALGQRVFAILVNGAVNQAAFDIYGAAQGTQRGYILEITGVTADITGTITLQFINGNSLYNGAGSPLICGIEVTLPQGTAGVAYSINCGGGAITPAAPAVSAAYGWSAVQQLYGIQSGTDVNDPLLATLAQCLARGQYEVNRAAWGRNPVTLITASVPTIEPAMLIQWFHPRYGSFGSDFWGYVASINRHTERAEAGGVDRDTYGCLVLYKQARTS